MGKPMPFPVWVSDLFLSEDFCFMTSAQRGGYLCLIFRCWEGHQCSLPDDGEKLRVLSMMTPEEWNDADIVRARFVAHPELPGRLTHPVVLEKWIEVTGYRASKSGAGKRGAEKRWQSHDSANGNSTDSANGKTIASYSSPSPTPIPSPKDPDSARAIPGTQQSLPVPAAPLTTRQVADVTSLLDHYVAELLAVRGVQTIRPKGKARETARDLLRLDNARELVSAFVRLDEPALRERGWPFTWIEQRVTVLQRAATGAGETFEGVRRG